MYKYKRQGQSAGVKRNMFKLIVYVQACTGNDKNMITGPERLKFNILPDFTQF